MATYSQRSSERKVQVQQNLTPQVLKPFWPEEAISIKEAAFLARKSEGTIRNWSANYFLGRPVGPRVWMVSRVTLAMYMDGNTQALILYLKGDRSSPEVVRYYERLGLGHLVKSES